MPGTGVQTNREEERRGKSYNQKNQLCPWKKSASCRAKGQVKEMRKLIAETRRNTAGNTTRNTLENLGSMGDGQYAKRRLSTGYVSAQYTPCTLLGGEIKKVKPTRPGTKSSGIFALTATQTQYGEAAKRGR